MEVQDRVKQRVATLPKPLELQPQFIPGQPGQQDFVRDTSGNLVPVGTTAPALTPEQRAAQELERRTKLAALESQLATAAKNSAEAAKIQQEIDRLKGMAGKTAPPGWEMDPNTGQFVRVPGTVTPQTLLGDYRTATKPFSDFASTLDTFTAAYNKNSKAGDLAMVNAFQRMIDPGAVVRDQDVQLIQATSDWKSRVEQLVKSIEEGQGLPEGTRRQLAELMAALATSAEERAAGVNAEFGEEVKFYNAPIRLREFKFNKPMVGAAGASTPLTPEEKQAARDELQGLRGMKRAR
jgi:hypothetical protein